MKKAIIITLFFAFVFSFAACAKKPNGAQTDTSGTTAQQTTEATTTTAAISTEVEITLPNYPDPKAIELNPDEEYPEEADYKCTYRKIYYLVPYSLVEVVGSEEFAEWEETMDYSPEIEMHEMSIAKMAKDFEIPKEDFIEVYESYVTFWSSMGHDLYSEGYELPNADIIYTFDNEVINAYYRRENPVAPDWTKVKTYESYAEYLEANP